MFALDLPPQLPMVSAYVAPALPAAGCDGLMISGIDIRTYPPSVRTAEERAAVALRASVRLRGERTAPFVVRAYVRLKAGQLCSEIALRETERLLRAQRFVASAAARAFPDETGGVRIRVDVVDEVPWVAGAKVQSTELTGFKLGSHNFRGRGLTLIGGTDWGGPFRPDARIHVGQYGAFGRPAFVDMELQRRHLGGLWRLGFAEPFITAGQTRAMRAAVAQELEYGRLVREGDEDAASRVQRSSYNIGMLWRVGAAQPSGLVGLGGVMILGSDTRASEEVLVVSDTGIFGTADTELAGRYPHYAQTRVAAVVALRALRFKSVQRFDALRARQDVGTGVQIEVLYGPSVDASATARDALTAVDLYLGAGGSESFASLKLRAEGRREARSDIWRGVVGAAQFTWHRLPSASRTRTVTLSTSRVDRLAFPGQFTFRDNYGGLIGFADSRESGGRRLVLRVEERRLLARPRVRAAMAVGAFVDAGKLWAGDVPYGSDSPVRASAGLSLFGAFPASGKRVYRLDFGVPFNPQAGASGFAVRVSSADRTGSLWVEPHDVTRVRTNPATILRW